MSLKLLCALGLAAVAIGAAAAAGAQLAASPGGASPSPLAALAAVTSAVTPPTPVELTPPGDNGSPSPPQTVRPPLGAGPYFVPVYGPSSYVDTFGAARGDVTYHHGDDIFGRLGQPLVAVADGTVFSIGWNRLGGNRLWLRDGDGNEFYYAHLLAFAVDVDDGSRVKAGEVVGFMGDSGDAEGTPTHLHFEVHPVSLLSFGYDGAVDPTGYLDGWKHLRALAAPAGAGWSPSPPGTSPGPEPGAFLLGETDIAGADRPAR